jgi:glycosyltransferase involved in cell wall biosynthesis
MKVSCLVVTQESRFEHFQRACRSFLRQTWPEKELVVAAYGSPEYLRRLAAYCDQLPMPTATAFTQTPTPLGQLRNLSVEAATGDIVCQWDDDDQYHPRRIEIQTRALVESAAEFCLLSDYWHYFADTGELYWLDFCRNRRGEPWNNAQLNMLPGSLTARRDAVFSYTPDAQGEDTLFLAYAKIKRRKFEVLSAAGWCYLYVYHGHNTMNRRQHHEGLIDRFKVYTAAEIEAIARRTQATLDPAFSLSQVFSHYELGLPQPAFVYGAAA